MLAISNLNVKLAGSHAGVSIGEDGPSQMALEDLAMFRAQPNFAVLYPCDAVSTEKLVAEMAAHPGPAYMAEELLVVESLDSDGIKAVIAANA